MTQKIIYDRTKQYYLDKLEILNGRAYEFYLSFKNQGYPEKIIRDKIWWSKIWFEAKILFKELNIHLYEHLTCEICFTGFYSPELKNFQLHHENVQYNWEKLFDPTNTHLVHKKCHLKKKLGIRPGDQK